LLKVRYYLENEVLHQILKVFSIISFITMSSETESKAQPWKAALAEQIPSNSSTEAAATDGKTGEGEFGPADKCTGTSSLFNLEEKVYDTNKVDTSESKAGEGEFGPADKCTGTSSLFNLEEKVYDTNEHDASVDKAGDGEYSGMDGKCVGTSTLKADEENLYDTKKEATT
jgi:hypothetical protein